MVYSAAAPLSHFDEKESSGRFQVPPVSSTAGTLRRGHKAPPKELVLLLSIVLHFESSIRDPNVYVV